MLKPNSKLSMLAFIVAVTFLFTGHAVWPRQAEAWRVISPPAAPAGVPALWAGLMATGGPDPVIRYHINTPPAVGIGPTGLPVAALLFTPAQVGDIKVAIRIWRTHRKAPGNLAGGVGRPGIDFQSLILHEIGHSFGLHHPNVGGPGPGGRAAHPANMDTDVNPFNAVACPLFPVGVAPFGAPAATREIAGGAFGVPPNTEAVMVQLARPLELQRRLAEDDLAGLRYIERGADLTCGTVDDFTYLPAVRFGFPVAIGPGFRLGVNPVVITRVPPGTLGPGIPGAFFGGPGLGVGGIFIAQDLVGNKVVSQTNLYFNSSGNIEYADILIEEIEEDTACGDTAGPGGTDVPCACGDTVVTDTTLTIGDTMTGVLCAGDGLIVADGVTLDLGGKWLRGRGVGTGVVIAAGANNVMVKNGGVKRFETGIGTSDSTSGSIVSNVIVTRNTADGMFVVGSRNILVENTSQSNGNDGIRVLGDGNVLERNLGRTNGRDGVGVEGSFNELKGNQGRTNGGNGVFATGGGNITDGKNFGSGNRGTNCQIEGVGDKFC